MYLTQLIQSPSSNSVVVGATVTGQVGLVVAAITYTLVDNVS